MPAAHSKPTPRTVYLRRGNTKKHLVSFYDDDALTVPSDVSTWTFEGGIHTFGDPSDLLAEYVITRPSAGKILFTLTLALIEALPSDEDTFGHYMRFRTAADSDVHTFDVGPAVLEEI